MHLLTYNEIEDYHGIDTRIVGIYSSWKRAKAGAISFYTKNYGKEWKDKWEFDGQQCYIHEHAVFIITQIELDKTSDSCTGWCEV